jgi:hypothetical protein
MKVFAVAALAIVSGLVSGVAHALTPDELVGCYNIVDSQTNSSEFRIENNGAKLGAKPAFGKTVPFPGFLVLSFSGGNGSFFKLKNEATNWTVLGEHSLQFYSSEALTDKVEGLFSKFASFTRDASGNVVLNYLEIFSSQGPSTQETKLGLVLRKKHCEW